MVIRLSYSDSAVVIPSYSDSAIVALRKKRGGLKNSFCRVKNEKDFVRIVVVKKIVKRKRVMFALNH